MRRTRLAAGSLEATGESLDPTKLDMHTLHGVVMAIAEGRKGPAKGGVLDG